MHVGIRRYCLNFKAHNRSQGVGGEPSIIIILPVMFKLVTTIIVIAIHMTQCPQLRLACSPVGHPRML